MTHAFKNTPIENYIPHRKPMLLLDTLLSIDAESMEARFTIKEDCIFLQENGTIEPVACMEILAQTFAAANGVRFPAKFGYLAAMRGMKVHGYAALGDTVLAKVRLITILGDIMVIEGALYKGEECIVEGQYKIFVPLSEMPDTAEEIKKLQQKG